MNNSTEALRTESKKRFIRNTGLIFLMVIVLMTFFSKTINDFLMPEVECKNPQSGSLETEIKASGEVKAASIVKIYSYGNWSILDVKVNEGAEVLKGDVLAEVDTKDVKLDMKTAELDILKMENALSQYRESFDTASEQEALNRLKQAAEKAQKELDTTRALFDSGAVAQKEMEEAEDRLVKAELEHTAQIKELDKRKIDYDRTLKEKEAEFQLKKLEYESLMRKIPRDGKIKATVDGIIQTCSIEKGLISSNGQVLFEISEKDSILTVEWRLNPVKAESLKVGDEVDIKLEPGDDISMDGTVKEKQYMANEGMYLFTSVIRMEGSGVSDGQKAEVSAVRKSAYYPFILPNSSISNQGGKDYVFVMKERDGVLGKENYVEMVAVKVEESDDFNSGVSSVIRPEDDIVVFSTKALADGMQVKLN